jgi:lipoprotein-anchoring transpeptidase ErfK/SrfK
MFTSLLSVLALVLAVPLPAADAATVEQAVPSSVPTEATATLRVGGLILTLVPEPVPVVAGSQGFEVVRLQRKLTDIGVYRGAIDGDYGPQTEAAVVAAHKLFGTERATAWLVQDWDLVDSLDHSAILGRNAEETDRVEVDIERQVMFIIRGADVAAIVPVSTGSGERYWSQNGGVGGGYVNATTPRGDYTLFRHVDGWRTNYLGRLYNAVHGSSSVPARPASHGCVRVPTWESNHLDDYLDIGLPVHIWDA